MFSNSIDVQKMLGVFAVMAFVALLTFIPADAHAIEIAFAGVTDQDDIITVLIKVLTAILRLIIAVLGVVFFVVGAYVILISIFDVTKGRESAGDVVGKIMLALVGVVVGLFFLNFSEEAISQLAEATTAYVEPVVIISAGLV